MKDNILFIDSELERLIDKEIDLYRLVQDKVINKYNEGVFTTSDIESVTNIIFKEISSRY